MQQLFAGKYQVAFGNAETDYETGTYVYHADTNTIEWLTVFSRTRTGREN